MFSSKKPYSSVTVAIESLTSEQYEGDDLSGIPDLVEAIKIQATGPTEAARAIRKKLKYGNVHRQLRALVVLDGLIQNAGSRFQRAFADEPLLERLRVCGTSELSDPQVRKKCKELFASWSVEYKKTPGLERISGLYKELPKRKQPVSQQQSKVLRETEQDPFEDAEDDDEESRPSVPAASSQSNPPPVTNRPFSLASTSHSSSFTGLSKKSKDKDKSKKKRKPFNLEAEKERMKSVIAESAVASTNLLNALQFINREHQRVSENKEAVTHFENCKLLRRQVLRYIQHVESEQWLGGLIHANDELVTALMTFEQLDTSIDADSDSEDELAHQAHLYNMATAANKGKESENPASPPPRASPPAPPQPARRPIPPPPVEPEEESEVEDDENDPFADRNEVSTPGIEKEEPSWKVV